MKNMCCIRTRRVRVNKLLINIEKPLKALASSGKKARIARALREEMLCNQQGKLYSNYNDSYLFAAVNSVYTLTVYITSVYIYILYIFVIQYINIRCSLLVKFNLLIPSNNYKYLISSLSLFLHSHCTTSFFSRCTWYKQCVHTHIIYIFTAYEGVCVCVGHEPREAQAAAHVPRLTILHFLKTGRCCHTHTPIPLQPATATPTRLSSFLFSLHAFSALLRHSLGRQTLSPTCAVSISGSRKQPRNLQTPFDAFKCLQCPVRLCLCVCLPLCVSM